MALHLFNRLEALDYLIRTKTTDTPAKLVLHLGISERTLYDFLDLMRELDAPIEYCKKCKSYYYKEHGGFEIRFKKIKSMASKSLEALMLTLFFSDLILLN